MPRSNLELLQESLSRVEKGFQQHLLAQMTINQRYFLWMLRQRIQQLISDTARKEKEELQSIKEINQKRRASSWL
jgi:hypothetical protein